MKLFSPVPSRSIVLGAVLLAPLALVATAVQAQAPATAAPAPVRQVGTVRAVSAGSLTLAPDSGSPVTFNLGDAVKVVQLPPGSTDIKAAQPAAVSDIAEGDRALVVGRPGDGSTVNATRIVLMKSAAIASNNADRQADWQRRGSGGIVSAVDPAAKTVSISSGTRKVTIDITPATVFRRYAPGSVKFEEAKLGTIADLQPGDQLRVRGTKSADGTTITAEEVVSGAFRNLSGTIASIDTAANTLTLKDLATKKTVTVAVSPESDLRNLPPEMAARFAAHAHGGSGTGTGSGAGAGSSASARSGSGTHGEAATAGTSASATTASGTPPPPIEGTSAAASATGAGGPGTAGHSGAGHSGGGDLSQVIGRLPKSTLADLKPGEAVMIVASSSTGNTGPATAITLLSGVEPLLAASPSGSSSFNISPWSLGGGGEGGEGAAQ